MPQAPFRYLKSLQDARGRSKREVSCVAVTSAPGRLHNNDVRGTQDLQSNAFSARTHSCTLNSPTWVFTLISGNSCGASTSVPNAKHVSTLQLNHLRRFDFEQWRPLDSRRDNAMTQLHSQLPSLRWTAF